MPKPEQETQEAELPSPVGQLGTPETDETLEAAIAKAEAAHGYDPDEDEGAMPEGHPDEEKPSKADQKPQEDEGDEDDEDGPEATDGPEAATDGPEADEETDEYDAAAAALLRDGWSLRDLKNLAAARVIELGAKAARRQADIDAKLRGQPAKGETGTDADTGAGDADLALPDSVVEALDDDAAKDLHAYMGKLSSRAVEPVLKQLTEAVKVINSHKAALDALHFNEARRELIADGYDELESPATWKAVREGVKKLDESKFTSYKELIIAATRGSAGDSARQRRTERYTKRDNGQPTPPSKKPGPPKKLTPSQREDERLRELEEQHGVSAA